MKPHRHMMSFAAPVTPISFIRKEHHMPMSADFNPTDTVYVILPLSHFLVFAIPTTVSIVTFMRSLSRVLLAYFLYPSHRQ